MLLGPFKKFIITIFFLMGVFFLGHYSRYQTLAYFSENVENILKKIPIFKFKDQSGDDFDLHSYQAEKNGNLFVHFWGTWCGPCEVELPSLLKMAKELKNENIKFILIAVKDDIDKVRKHIKKFEIQNFDNIRVILDPDGIGMREFGTFKVPESYIFNKSGVLYKKFIGPQDWNNLYFRDQIVKSLSL